MPPSKSLPQPCLLPVWAPPEAAMGCEQVKAATLGLPDTATLQFNEADPDAQGEGLAGSMGEDRRVGMVKCHNGLGQAPHPGQPSLPAHSCTVPALQGSGQQTPLPCVRAALACPCGEVGEVVGAEGGLGGAAPSGRTAVWSTMCPAELVGDREAGQWAVCSHGLPSPTLNRRALALTLTLCAKHKYPLAGDDLEFVVLAAAGHLNGSQRDHTLGEGVLERQPNDPQRQKLSQMC